MKRIVLNTQKVKSILNGYKTSERIIINKDIINSCDIDVDGTLLDCENDCGDFINPVKFCKYQIGDIIYVAETWQQVFDPEVYDNVRINEIIGNWDCIRKTIPEYQPQTNRTAYIVYKSDDLEFINSNYGKLNWKPSIQMPKEYASLFLRVTDVRVEKLQDMDADDAFKEGCGECSEEEYAQFWDNSLSKKDAKYYSWEFNPWVYVVKFERCDKDGNKIM